MTLALPSSTEITTDAYRCFPLRRLRRSSPGCRQLSHTEQCALSTHTNSKGSYLKRREVADVRAPSIHLSQMRDTHRIPAPGLNRWPGLARHPTRGPCTLWEPHSLMLCSVPVAPHPQLDFVFESSVDKLSGRNRLLKIMFSMRARLRKGGGLLLCMLLWCSDTLGIQIARKLYLPFPW